MRYAVTLAPDDNGTILVTVPDVPEAVTFGEDRDDALARAVDAIETAMMGAMAAREDAPAPQAVGAEYVNVAGLVVGQDRTLPGHAGGWRRQGRACETSRRRIAASGPVAGSEARRAAGRDRAGVRGAWQIDDDRREGGVVAGAIRLPQADELRLSRDIQAHSDFRAAGESNERIETEFIDLAA